jgi:hypothetical protein
VWHLASQCSVGGHFVVSTINGKRKRTSTYLVNAVFDIPYITLAHISM